MKIEGGVDLNGHKATNAADGVANNDLATVGQMKNLANGFDFKDAAVVAVSSNVTVAAPGATLNGVSPSTLDRVLLLGQTAGAENGVWVWNGAGVPMTRPADFVTGEVTQGATLVALGGSNPTKAQWSLTTAGPITVGTTSLAFTITGSPGSTYTNGAGLLLSGGTFSVDTGVVVRKYAQDVGDGTTTSIDVTHGLGTLDVQVQVRDKGNNLQQIIVDNGPKSGSNPNVLTLYFVTAPTAAQYRVIVFG